MGDKYYMPSHPMTGGGVGLQNVPPWSVNDRMNDISNTWDMNGPVGIGGRR